MPRDLVTLINRTSKPLEYRFDGIDEILTPGENPGVPRKHIESAKNQNKRMGTEKFYNPNDFVCLVGVKDSKDDCSPIEQSDAPQVIDRDDKNERDGQVSETRKAPGPTVFDSRMPGSEDSSAAFSGTQGDGRPAGARKPQRQAAGRQTATAGRRR